MYKHKFEYFLNAIHYGFWLKERTFNNVIRKIVDILSYPIHILFYLIRKFLFTKNMRERYYENTKKSQDIINDFYYNKKRGFCIGFAHHNFGAFYSIYFCILSDSIAAIGIKIFDDLNLIVIISGLIPLVLCYIPAYKAVFSKDKYLQYFKQFEKEDERWHKKWERRTTMFILGAIASFLLGLGLFFAILGVKIKFPWM